MIISPKAGKTQSKPGRSYARKKVLKDKQNRSKGHRKQLEDADWSNLEFETTFSIKKNNCKR